jgi:hypothetical protein
MMTPKKAELKFLPVYDTEIRVLPVTLDCMAVMDLVYTSKFAVLFEWDNTKKDCMLALEQRLIKLMALERADNRDVVQSYETGKESTTYLELLFAREKAILEGCHTQLLDDQLETRMGEIEAQRRTVLILVGGMKMGIGDQVHGAWLKTLCDIMSDKWTEKELNMSQTRDVMKFPTLAELINKQGDMRHCMNEQGDMQHCMNRNDESLSRSVYDAQQTALSHLDDLILKRTVEVLQCIDTPSPQEVQSETDLQAIKFPGSPNMAYMWRHTCFCLGRFSPAAEVARTDVIAAACHAADVTRHNPDGHDFETLLVLLVEQETLELCEVVKAGQFQRAEHMFKRHLGPFARQLGFNVGCVFEEQCIAIIDAETAALRAAVHDGDYMEAKRSMLDGFTAFAQKMDNYHVRLCGGGSVNICKEVFGEINGGTILHILADARMIPSCLNRKDYPLRSDILSARIWLIKYLSGSDSPVLRDDTNSTPLMIACAHSHFDNPKIMAFLAREYDKTTINFVDVNGRSALTQCCQNGTTQMMDVLLRNGADPLCEVSKKNCFYLAIDNTKTSVVGMLDCLVSHEPLLLDMINERHFRGITALEYFAYKFRTFCYCSAMGQAHRHGVSSKQFEVMRWFLAKGAWVLSKSQIPLSGSIWGPCGCIEDMDEAIKCYDSYPEFLESAEKLREMRSKLMEYVEI